MVTEQNAGLAQVVQGADLAAAEEFRLGDIGGDQGGQGKQPLAEDADGRGD